MNILILGLFGFLGVLCRYFLDRSLTKYHIWHLPVSIFAINCFGSFLAGLCFIFFQNKCASSSPLPLYLMTGFLGGFTTFSAFSIEIYKIFHTQGSLNCLLYVLFCNFFAIFAVFLGAGLGKILFN